MTTISVAHTGAQYDVIIGDIREAVPRLQALSAGRRLPIISDQSVMDLHASRLAGVSLEAPILVPQGEAAKDWGTLAHVVDRLAELEVRRGTPILAFGGGSVGDVAGMAASVFKRGCPIIHIPTTLLAQADSAIGGKTAIDAAGHKNLVGTFHHPALVLADPGLLSSLDKRQMRSGYAEVLKYGLIEDEGFFTWCEAHAQSLLGAELDTCRFAIEHSVQAKSRRVMADPHDTSGERALLNFGHTFGHAIEALAGHRLLHGEAVALGMMLAFSLSAELGHCDPADRERVRVHLLSAGLPVEIGEVGLNGEGDAIVEAMRSDKKQGAQGLTLVLTRGIGQAFVAKPIEASILRGFLSDLA